MKPEKSMIGSDRKDLSKVLALWVLCLFLLSSCSSIPFFGKKKEEKPDVSQGKTVTVDGMETVKGVNPPKAESPPAARKPAPPPSSSKTESRTASIPFSSRPPSYASPLPFLTAGLRKKVVILDFENKTTYREEKIGETVAQRLSDRLEATQRVVVMDRRVILDLLRKEGLKFETLSDPAAMKKAHQSLGVQALVQGTVDDVSLLPQKPRRLRTRRSPMPRPRWRSGSSMPPQGTC
jgi:hypothetical protein